MTHSDSRDAILSRVRASIKSARHGNSSTPEELARTYRQSGNLTREECLRLFTERLREYDAEVIATDSQDLPGLIARVIQENVPRSSDSGFWVAADGFPKNWLGPEVSVRGEAEASVDDLNSCSGVMTTCTAGIALTGTIVLQHGAGEGRRRTTLLPDRHLCVVRASQVVETVPEAFARLESAATRPLTFISGPSATADIEMTRIRGVHGPRQLHVILVND